MSKKQSVSRSNRRGNTIVIPDGLGGANLFRKNHSSKVGKGNDGRKRVTKWVRI